MGFSKSSLLAAGLMMGQASAALQPIVMKGSKFFYENGTQFYMKGVAYQQAVGAAGAKSTSSSGYIDPLSDTTICKRDVPILAAAGTNTIRVYAIDPTADHTQCMKMLDDAGIYVVADLGEPSLSIERDNPQWNVGLFDRYKKVIDELAKYDNVIGFFSGNEVTNNKTNTGASAYVKAATRDSKNYIKSKGGRWMGVGYATNDDTDIRVDLANYFNCGNQSDAIDYWGYNIYSWCGKSSMEASGYTGQVDFFKNYSVPVFFAEYGCNEGPLKSEGRDFSDATALYSDAMTGVFSGGIVYMYYEEDNNYGLVKVDSSGSATTMKNYDALKKAVTAAKPKTIEMSSYTPSNKAAECPATHDKWRANANLPPTPDKSVCDCMVKAATCAPSSSVSSKQYGEIFGYICAQSGNPCGGINGNATTGIYGPYSMCDDKAKLTHVLDTYYKSQKNSAGACDFKGKAEIVSSPSTPSSCTAALSSASAAVENARTATAAASAGGDKSGAVSVRELAVGLYAVAAMGLGALVML
ncbi:hypothetical protein RB595_007825 [Gaeumannomyces hyphopodioides]